MAATRFRCWWSALLLLAAAPAAARAPQRVVSLNLCADQLLLAVADRAQIAGLTPNAPKPQLSAAAAQVAGLPVLGESAEQVLAIRPDLVVGMPARRSAIMTALQNERYRAIDLRSAQNFPQIARNIRLVARAVGHPDRGEALVRDMTARLQALPRPGRGRIAAYYQRRGFLTGSGTLIDDLMQRMGLGNLATRLGKGPLAQLSLEELVAAQPDLLILESESARVADQGTEMLHHPALAGIPRIYLPQSWTVCGGPAYVQAAELLARALAPH